MDMHSCLNRMIQSICPSITSHNSLVLCQIFKQGIREAAIGEFIFLGNIKYLSQSPILDDFVPQLIIYFKAFRS